jgi:hypothetical protein
MQTRSQSQKQLINSTLSPADCVEKAKYEVNIDFDEASTAWKANKKSKGNGTYRYVCEAITKTDKKCTKEPIKGCIYCKIHKKQNTIQK